MERTRLIVNFDSSCDKLLSTENVIACGETFDILFRDVTLSGTVRVAFWDYETLLWRSEGSASQGDGGSILEGLVADTKELADVFRGGSGFFAARMTVGEQVGGDEWRDYGVAYVRLYRGTNPYENPEPARPDVYPTEEELNAWLDEFEAKRADAEKQAKASEESAGESAKAAARAQKAAEEAKAAAEKVGDFSDHLDDHNNPHKVTAEQVACDETSAAIANIDGADNWGEAWGFDLDLRSINPDVWEGRADGTVASVTQIGLQVSGAAGKNIRARMKVTGTDGVEWTSATAPSWNASGEGVDYRFDPAMRLPNGVMKASFVTEEGAAVTVPLRISKVSATETPAGCDVWTAEGGTSKRTDFAPRIRSTNYEVTMSVQDALGARLTAEESDVRYLRVDSAKTNNLQKAIRFYAHTGEQPTTPDANSPFFVLGSQLKDDGSGDIKEDRWALFLAYNGFTFRQTPGSGDEFFGFARGQSYSFVRQKELDDATQDAITADGGTVDGILRMKNPKVAADDNPEHDIAIVPNADGAGLQVQFPGGSTAMIRMKTGTLATVQEVNDAIENIELTPGPQGPQGEKGDKGDPGDDASVPIDTTMPSSPADDHVPSTQLLNELLAGYLKLSGGSLDVGAQLRISFRDGGGLYSRVVNGTAFGDPSRDGGIFLNWRNTNVPSEIYLNDGVDMQEKHAVLICGRGNDCIALRRMDGDYLYAAKGHTHSSYLDVNSTAWQHLKGPIAFDFHDPAVASVNITSINGVSSGTDVIEHGRLYINNDTSLDTNAYLNGMRQVYIAGSPAIRKLDGDNLYAPKAETYTKAEVDGKITSALGNIQAALAAI